MKKKSIKNLQLKKKLISNFQEKLNGGLVGMTKTNCTTTTTIVNITIFCYTYQDESMCWE